MTPRPTFLSVTPMVPAGPSLTVELQLYTEHLGFNVNWQSPNMAGIARDGVELLLVENNEQLWTENASYSFGVTDLDALYAEYADIPAKVGPLEVKFWGRREFHVIMPSGVCFQFYQREPS